jgi:hypothetical protein
MPDPPAHAASVDCNPSDGEEAGKKASGEKAHTPGVVGQERIRGMEEIAMSGTRLYCISYYATDGRYTERVIEAWSEDDACDQLVYGWSVPRPNIEHVEQIESDCEA